MSTGTILPGDARPVLLRGVRTHWDKVRGNWVLLAPERALALDAIGAAILAETDGETAFAEIIERLARKYNAPAEQIASDASRFLVSLIERRMAEVRP
jgi:pyrroloquinoline quinone biosynthesis protein D